jgi:hypothetical protein
VVAAANGRSIMTEQAAKKKAPKKKAPKAGYVVAVIVNVVIWVLLNVSPGWQAVSFLTDDVTDVLWLVNLSLGASILVNLAYLIYDAPWFRSLGQLIISLIGVAVAYEVLVVFPFDLAGGWELLARVVLVIAVLGSAVGAIVELVRLIRRLGR